MLGQLLCMCKGDAFPGTCKKTLLATQSVFSEFNQRDATFLKFIYFRKTLYMFQTVFPSIIMTSKLHIERQAFVRPILLPAASLTLYVQF